MNQLSTELVELIRKAVEDPDLVVLGKHGEHIAIRLNEELGKEIVVPMKMARYWQLLYRRRQINSA